jgi:hypothetical protein
MRGDDPLRGGQRVPNRVCVHPNENDKFSDRDIDLDTAIDNDYYSSNEDAESAC